MAVTRTILPRKGLIQSQHGLVNYEADQDANWALLDANVAFAADLLLPDLNLNGVVSGFTLSSAATLTPGLTTGILWAQGKRYAPAATPNPGPANANATNYLWYNSSTGFYYNTSGTANNTGDAFLGVVVTNATAVTSVTPSTKVYGQVSVAPSAPGNFAVAHNLGRVPVGVNIQLTSGGLIWFQPGTMYDATNLYLVASDAGVTAKVQVW